MAIRRANERKEVTMIYKNDYGTNELQFGTGDIEVGNGRIPSNDEKQMYPCCIFTQKEPGEIGAYCNPDAKNEPAEQQPDAHTLFVFTDIRSIDVVIDHLNQAKERFARNGSKAMSKQEITDEVKNMRD